jgi:two-component system OmpR family response regulator
MPSPHILVVDDDPPVLNVIARMLKKSGYQVTATDRGLKVLEICRRQNIGLLLLDYRLFDVHSLDLLQQVRAEGFTFPVLLISGLGQMLSYVLKNEQDLKPLYTLDKPFTHEELEEAVQKILASEAQEKQTHP